MSIFFNLLLLIFASFFLTGMYEVIAGNESFSLPLINILLVTVVGFILFFRFGWFSTGVVLGVYALWAAAAGLWVRKKFPPRQKG